MKHYGALLDVMGALRGVTEALWIVVEHYGALMECRRTVMENTDFTHH